MTVSSPTEPAHAFILRGHWVAECPRGCGQVQFLFVGHAPSEDLPCACMTALRTPTWFCRHCRHLDELVWPPNVEELWDALAARPPVNRNWFPAEHRIALEHGLAHGLSTAELCDESAAHGVST